jgi:hypothetical protein
MKLNEIKNILSIDLLEKKVEDIESDLKSAKDEYTAFLRKHKTVDGSLQPQALEQKKRHQAKIKALNQALKIAKEAPSDAENAERKQFISKVDNRKQDKQATKERASKALSDGLKSANAWVTKQGGYEAAAKVVEQMIKKQTNNGQHEIDAEAIAKEIGITPGSVRRWINSRPEFKHIKNRYR